MLTSPFNAQNLGQLRFLMFLLLGFETKGRSIEEINRALDTPAGVAL